MVALLAQGLCAACEEAGTEMRRGLSSQSNNAFLHGIFGTRLRPRFVGYEITCSAPSSEGTIGIFALHRDEAGEFDFPSAHNLRIKEVREDGSEEPFYVSTAYGGYAIWEGPAPKGEQARFVIYNGKDEKVARFQMTKQWNGKFSIVWFGVSRILPVLNNEGDTRRSRGRSNRSTHSSDTLFQSEQPEAEGVLMSEAEQRY